MKQTMRRTKMMLVLPVLIIPFLTMGFWALGGGKGSGTTNLNASKGLNLNLPVANLKDEVMDKLAFYDRADKDSLKRQEYMRSDPYYKVSERAMPVENELEQISQTTASKFNQSLNTSPYEVSRANPEKKLLDKLAMLEKELSKPSDEVEEKQVDREVGGDPEFAGQVDRLESMMEMMNKGDTEDPEMNQLDGTLDKILDIQHPSRVMERIKEKSLQDKELVFTVNKKPTEVNVSLLDTMKAGREGTAGFFGLDEDSVSLNDNKAIEVVVHENQTLVNGAVIKFRLLHDIFINGAMIPKGNFVFGIATLHDERLEATINSVRCNQSLFPVKLEVYDMDGMPGIYIPGAITRDVAKQSADNSLQLMELSPMDPSLKAQATTAGIGAAKNLLSKKVKLVKAMVKAGYKVLLKDKN